MKRFLIVTLTGLLSVTAQSPAFAQLTQVPSQGPLQEPFSLDDPAPPYENFYTLGAGDRVYMDVYNLPDYSREYQVLADGTLNLPLIGTVYAEGKTLAQLSEEVEAKYARYIRIPAVTFDLQQARALQVAVAGEVRRPGSYDLEIDTQQAPDTTTPAVPTVSRAIQAAGGITESADIRNIRVYRPAPQSPSEGQWIDINLWALIQEGDLSQDLPLRDGDSIVIPEAPELVAEDILTAGAANFSPATINVYVAGQVQDPGLVELPPNTTLNQALLAAGGRIASAARAVTLVRLNPNGTVTERRIRVDYEAGIDDERNPALRHNDAILVRRSTLARVTDTLNTALSPVGGFANIFRIVDVIDEITTNEDNDNDDEEEDERREPADGDAADES